MEAHIDKSWCERSLGDIREEVFYEWLAADQKALMASPAKDLSDQTVLEDRPERNSEAPGVMVHTEIA